MSLTTHTLPEGTVYSWVLSKLFAFTETEKNITNQNHKFVIIFIYGFDTFVIF